MDGSWLVVVVYVANSSHVNFNVALSQKLAQIIIFVIKHRSK